VPPGLVVQQRVELLQRLAVVLQRRTQPIKPPKLPLPQAPMSLLSRALSAR
jgi:hypothetical protein